MEEGVLRIRGGNQSLPPSLDPSLQRFFCLSFGAWIILLMRIVLPAISTDGMSSDDVDALTESTREKMVAALRDISSLGPLGKTSAKDAPRLEDLTSEAQDGSGKKGDSDNTGMSREESRTSSRDGHESKGSTTEDEMDEDAVLLKRPTGA